LREYELIYIVRPDVEEETLEELSKKVDQFVTGSGGQVTEVKRWGKRRLAYPIQKLKEGYYVLNRIQLEPQMLKEVERSLTLSEEIIRYLIVRV
jgi:small subunit ribosomal protein S6